MQTIENDVKSKQSSDELQSLESHEWNKPPINRYDIEEDESEKIVLDEDYQQIETKHGETKVVLCFPKEQQDTNFIKDEIKSILMYLALEKYQYPQGDENYEES